MFAASLISFESLVPVALFGAFAALAWWGLDLMMAAKPRAIERLEELADPRKRRNPAAESALKKTDAFTRVLERASPSLAKPLQPKNEAEFGKLKTKTGRRRVPRETAGSIFLGFKFAGLVTGLLVGGGAITSLRGVNQTSLIWSVVWLDCFFTFPISLSASSVRPPAGDLPRPARRPRPDGGLRRGRLGTRSSHAQGGR